MNQSDPDIMRLRYKYRKLIMEGEIRLPYQDAAKLIGPDCAYHLYATFKGEPGTPAAEERLERRKRKK